MHDDDWLTDVFKQYIWETPARDRSMNYQQIYEILSRKEQDMAYSYSRGYYNDTRGDEVATAVLEAYSQGIDFDVLLKKNKQVRAYWSQVQGEKIRLEQAREREAERQRKLAEKRAIEQAKREEVMTKLTPEELEAFGLVKKPRKVTKR